MEPDPTVRDEGKAQDLLIIGPPITGKTSLAWALHERLPYPIVTLDDAIGQCLKMRTPLGAQLRHALGRWTKKERDALDDALSAIRGQVTAARTALEAVMKVCEHSLHRHV